MWWGENYGWSEDCTSFTVCTSRIFSNGKVAKLCLYIVGRVANAANIAIVIRVKIDVYQEQRTVVHFQR